VKEFVHMKKVAIPSVVVNEDVIKENQDKFLKVRFQYFIHDTLEGGWGIAKDKRHDQEFLMSFMSSERSIRNIFLLHQDLVIVIEEV
jgi:hypothetical protein